MPTSRKGTLGAEVCKYLYETRPETQVIILTAYSDFDYAKFAIKYNACEYVLKISIMDELPEALEKATGKLTQLKKEIEKEEIAVSGQRTLLQQIDQYVEQNFKNKISLDEIADELHVNRSYLSRFYKNKTGINLFDTILNLRIAQDVPAENTPAEEQRFYIFFRHQFNETFQHFFGHFAPSCVFVCNLCVS